MSDRNYDRSKLIEWYDRHSDRYDEESFIQNDELYGGDLYRIDLVSDLLRDLRPGRCLDVGCGTAEPMLRFLGEGHDVRGFDLSPGMIEQAKVKLADAGHDPARAEVADILDPAVIERAGIESYDAVIANGVMPYIEDTETAHRHLASLVKPGGWFISAYTNKLFDLCTYNRFTVQTYKEWFIDPLDAPEDTKRRVTEGLAGLMTNPDKPKSIPHGARDEIYLGSFNPLTIWDDLAPLGLERADLLFYKFHAFPPLLRALGEDIAKGFNGWSRSWEIEHARDWRGHFLCSSFIVVARKAVS